MADRRRHSSILALPSEVQQEINDLLVEPNTTYDEVRQYIVGKGYDVSRSSVARYGKGYFEQLRQTKIVEEQAKTIIEQGGSQLEVQEALAKLLTAEIMSRLIGGKLSKNADINFATESFSKLFKASVSHQLMKKEIKDAVDKVAKKVEGALKREGVRPEVLNNAIKDIYGIVS